MSQEFKLRSLSIARYTGGLGPPNVLNEELRLLHPTLKKLKVMCSGALEAFFYGMPKKHIRATFGSKRAKISESDDTSSVWNLSESLPELTHLTIRSPRTPPSFFFQDGIFKLLPRTLTYLSLKDNAMKASEAMSDGSFLPPNLQSLRVNCSSLPPSFFGTLPPSITSLKSLRKFARSIVQHSLPHLLMDMLDIDRPGDIQTFRGPNGWIPKFSRLIITGDLACDLLRFPLPSTLVALTLRTEAFSLSSEILASLPRSITSMKLGSCDWKSIKATDWPSALTTLTFLRFTIGVAFRMRYYEKLPRGLVNLYHDEHYEEESPDLNELLKAGKCALEGLDRDLWTSTKFILRANAAKHQRGEATERYIESAEAGAFCGLPLKLVHFSCSIPFHLIDQVLLPPNLAKLRFTHSGLANSSSLWERLPPSVSLVVHPQEWSEHLGNLHELPPHANPMYNSRVPELDMCGLRLLLPLLPRTLTTLSLSHLSVEAWMLCALPSTLTHLKLPHATTDPSDIGSWAFALPRGLKVLDCPATFINGQDFVQLPPQLETLTAIWWCVTIDHLLDLPKTLRQATCISPSFIFEAEEGYIPLSLLIDLPNRFFPFWRIFTLPRHTLQSYTTETTTNDFQSC